MRYCSARKGWFQITSRCVTATVTCASSSVESSWPARETTPATIRPARCYGAAQHRRLELGKRVLHNCGGSARWDSHRSLRFPRLRGAFTEPILFRYRGHDPCAVGIALVRATIAAHYAGGRSFIVQVAV